MSRYLFTPPAWPAHRSCVIGWDDALESYFALVLGDDGQVIAAAGDNPPAFVKIDDLLPVINAHLNGQLPPIQLTEECRIFLLAEAGKPVINAIGITTPAANNTPPAKPASRAPALLGTQAGFLDAEGLHDMLDGMADTFCHLETLYHAKIAADADTETTARIHHALGSLEIVCHLLASMAQTPDIVVASSALEPFRELAADAGHILDGEAAGIPAPLVH